MTIATLNIDWAKKYSSNSHEQKIIATLSTFDFDILVLTEAISINLPNFHYQYFSENLSENKLYEGVNYATYLRGTIAHRVIVYSKFSAIKILPVKDPKTSLALELSTSLGNIILYATIIGTQFRKQPYATVELENCITDCKNLFNQNPNLFIVGDFNTSFLADETSFSINQNTTKQLSALINFLNLQMPTATLRQNIDHIAIPNSFIKNTATAGIFIEKNSISDHQGVYVTI